MLLEIILSFLVLLVSRILWRRWKYDLHKIPSPPGLPLIGHALEITSNRGEGEVYQFITAKWKQLGRPSMMKLKFGGHIVMYLRDLDAAKELLSSRTIPVKRSAFIINFVGPLVAIDPKVKRLANTPGVTPYVKAVRKVFAKGLQSDCLKTRMNKLHEVLDDMFAIIEAQRQKGPIDFQELCVRMTLDAIGVLALDKNLRGLNGKAPLYKHVVEVGHICMGRAFNALQAWTYKALPFLEGACKEQATVEALTAEWRSLADEILARDDPPAGEEPIWYLLKTLQVQETGKKITYDQLVAEIAGVVIAGMDTTGHQLPCILALLASNPPVVERLISELKECDLYRPECRNITLEDLSDMPYLSAVVKEGMRVAHISSSALERELGADATILGYRLPKGTSVTIQGLRWTNLESEWDDPDEFKPERWLAGEDLSRKFYMPFGYGPRDCAGQKLALLEMRIAIARLVQRYHLKSDKPVNEVLLDSRAGLVVEAAGGIWLHVEPRR